MVAGLPAAFAVGRTAIRAARRPREDRYGGTLPLVLLIGGMPGNPLYARRYRDWLTRLPRLRHHGLAGIPKERVVVLSGDKDFKSPISAARPRPRASARRSTRWPASCGPKTNWSSLLVGHGTVTETGRC